MKPSYAFVIPWDLHHAGGVNQVVLNLYRQMLAAGEMQPLIMVNRWSAARPVEEVVDGHRVVYLRMRSPWPEGGSVVDVLKWLLTAPVSLIRLLRFARRHRVAAFNLHFASLEAFPVAVLRLLRLYRGDLILSFHGLDLTAAWREPRIARALWKLVLRQTTAVVACSQAFASEVAAFTAKQPTRISVVRNGLDIDHFLSQVDRRSDNGTDALPAELLHREFILSVATFEPNKALDVLLRAFARVRRASPPPNDNLALVLVGRSAEAEGDLRALAAELGLARDVFFCVNVPHAQVGLFFERAKVFCLPSRYEPFGIAILEAAAYHLPVVATRIGGIPEIVTDGTHGLLVESENPDALAQALQRVLSDPGLARTLADRLYDRVVKDFRWERAYDEYRAIAAA